MSLNKQDHLKSTPQIDIVAGIMAGIVGNLISHPLDTVKVRMQLSTQGESIKLMSTINEIYKREGVRIQRI